MAKVIMDVTEPKTEYRGGMEIAHGGAGRNTGRNGYARKLGTPRKTRCTSDELLEGGDEMRNFTTVISTWMDCKPVGSEVF